MKTTVFSYQRVLLVLSVSILTTTMLACGTLTRETPTIGPAPVSSATATISTQLEPVLSGDGGDLIAFIHIGDVCVMELDGRNTRCLTDDGSVYLDSLAWSPDGSQIAFVSSRDGDGCEIYVVGVDGGDAHRLTHENHCNSSLVWSPDGSQIAFASDRDGNDNIYVMEVDGSNVRRLSGESYWNGYPTWSPDSSQIAFVSVRSASNHEICVMSAVDGSDLYCLTESNTMHKNLSWSPDGSRIAFVSDQNGNDDIYVLEVDGGNVRRLTEDSAVESSPTWSPDSSQLAFASQGDGGAGIYTMNADGSNIHPLTDNNDWEMSPAWQPDRDRVVVVVARVKVPGSTTTAAPTPTIPASEVQPLRVVDTWFALIAPDRLSFAFMVENPNQNLALENTRYHVAANDDAGAQVGTCFGTIDLVLPGEQLGVTMSGVMVISADAEVAQLDIQLEPGEAKTFAETGNPLVAEQGEFFPATYGSRVTVVVNNSLDMAAKDVQVAVFAFDANGVFMSGGVDHIDLVPAYGQAAVEIRLETTGEPAQIEFYPSLPDLSAFEQAATALQTIEPEAQWFSQEGTRVNFAFVFENPDQTLSLEDTTYQVAAYDEAGTVLGTYSHAIPVVFPAQRLGLASWMQLLKDAQVAKLDVQISPGESQTSELTGGPFTTERVTFTRDPIYAKVTGIVQSVLEKNVTHLAVTAIVYDENDTIIGGGDTILDFVPANGQAAASVNVETTAAPAKVELYPRLHEYSRLSDVSAQEQVLTVEATGACRDLTGAVRFAFVVKSSDQTMTFLNTAYQAAAYDQAGNVLGTRSGSIPVLFPNEQLGVANTLLASGQANVDRVEIQLNPEETIVSELVQNPFMAEQVEFIPDQIFPQVTGIVKSSWGKEVGVTFTVIAYDENGGIIGGGFANGVAEAHGQGTVAVNVDLAGQQPDRVELYPAFQTHVDFSQ